MYTNPQMRRRLGSRETGRSLAAGVKGLLVAAMVAGGLGWGAASAQASMIEVSFTGFDFVWSGDATGGTISDAGSPDALASINFKYDGNIVASYDVIGGDLMTADVSIGFGSPLAPGGVISGGSGLFDLTVVDALSNSYHLWLDVFDVILWLSGSKVTVSGATGNADVFSQLLPAGLLFVPDQDLLLTFSGNVSGLTESGGYATGFNASGTGLVKGPGIPEPASIALIAPAGLMLLRRRR